MESRNDRNDRAIRSAMSWYQSHFAENGIDGVKVVLLTNDKAHLNKSINQGILVYTGTADDTVILSALNSHLLFSRLFSTDVTRSMELCTGYHFIDNRQYANPFSRNVWLV